MFQQYSDSATIYVVLTALSAGSYTMLWAYMAYLHALSSTINRAPGVGLVYSVPVITLLVLVNTLYGYAVPSVAMIVMYLAVGGYAVNKSSRRSLSWVFGFFAFMPILILSAYTFFSYSLAHINVPQFQDLGITNHVVKYKPFTMIYQGGVLLNYHTFDYNGEHMIFDASTIYARQFLFYHAMNIIGLLFWMIVFTYVVNKHGVTASRFFDALWCRKKGLGKY